MRQENGDICSDTMTSAQTPINSYFRGNFKDEFEDAKKINTSNPKQKISAFFCAVLYFNYPNVKDKIDKYDSLTAFIKSNHKLGNYIPVPKGFNVARSKGGYKDSWDLTLLKIREYYFTDEDKKIKFLKEWLGERKNTNVVKNTDRWLKIFVNEQEKLPYNNWKNFIKFNYLEDFVEDDKLEVKMFGKSRTYEKSNIYGDDFFKTCNVFINKRTNKMICELKERLG